MGIVSISLTRGQFAIIDELDLELVSKYKWRWVSSRMASGYAETNIPVGRKGHIKGIRRPRHRVTMHQLILGVDDADHKNGDGLDNTRGNLRRATRSQQGQNRGPNHGKRFKGVGLWHGKWRARILTDGNSILLGYFQTEEEGARAYNAAAIKYFGEFARLNDV